MPPISVSGSTLNRVANPTPFLSTDIPSQWTGCTTRRTALPLPHASSDFPPPLELMPPSTPLELTHHKQARSERESEHRALNQRANAAKEAADADPGNKAKALEYRQLCEDYAADFGLFVPDADIDKHLILRQQESTQLDGLWDQEGLPGVQRGPLQAYMDAVEEFNATFGQPYQPAHMDNWLTVGLCRWA
ncbi:hypothetical protein B0H14DRAFT_2649824 [Mycena olivaceomarginata]|nr:hypothetical protein B0H14DRAFT_2649824 [Mycena olivaceomarginata]